MTILWCGGEDIDVNCTMGNSYDATFSRGSLFISAKVDTPNINPVTNVWLSVRSQLSEGPVAGSAWAIGLLNSADVGIVLRVREQSGTTHLDIIKTDGSLLSEGTILISTYALHKLDLQVIQYGETGTVNSYIDSILNTSYTGDLTPSSGDVNIVKGSFWRCSYTPYGYDHSSISEIIIADEDTRLMRLKTLAPSAAGDASTNWTGAYTDIDEVTLSDADRIYSSTGNADFQCNLTGMPADTYTVKAVKVAARAVDGSGSLGMALGVKTGGTVNVGATETCSGYWQTKERLMTINPVSGVAWTPADIEALQLNIRAKAV